MSHRLRSLRVKAAGMRFRRALSLPALLLGLPGAAPAAAVEPPPPLLSPSAVRPVARGLKSIGSAVSALLRAAACRAGRRPASCCCWMRRRAADTEAQCTAASYAPAPCSVSRAPGAAAPSTTGAHTAVGWRTDSGRGRGASAGSGGGCAGGACGGTTGDESSAAESVGRSCCGCWGCCACCCACCCSRGGWEFATESWRAAGWSGACVGGRVG
mmetsp:Transcript_18221/g.54831  ORF Transcript_18221/g.54831 Transcript_18221/m.54831 type:complete len:214 (-) Transcript_18221:159-800(-)